MYAHMTVLALFILFYGLVAGGLKNTAVSGPMLYVAFGAVLSFAHLGLEPISLTGETLKTLAELALALVLFTDAANADLGALRQSFRLPQRLLLLGLPLTILLGFVAAALLFTDLSLIEAAILAVMLAPTDAALGEPVVSNPAVPDEIRDALNVESGLNDGVCVPILFVFLAMAADENAYGGIFGLALRLVIEEIGIGLLAGAALTLAASLAIKAASRRGFIQGPWKQVPVAALAVGCFALAQVLGGSGFIASFAGGLLFGALTKSHKKELLEAAEGYGEVMALLTWVVFGYAVIGQLRGPLSWPMLAYALLSLTVARMLPVYGALSGLGMDARSKLFVGWFGPRGLASVVFTIMILDQGLPGARTIALTAVVTVALSVLLHGATASPLARAYAASSRR